MSSLYLTLNAWREILARTFDGLEYSENVSPKWLINPATGRRLKLDRLYPDIGFAVRFVGLTGKGNRRQSDWEILETEQREQTRAELCRLNDIQLFFVDPTADPIKLLDRLLRLLGDARRGVSKGQQSAKAKKRFISSLDDAKAHASQMRRQIGSDPTQAMVNLAESWRDRETSLATPSRSEPAQKTSGNGVFSKQKKGKLVLEPGRRVHHARFGEGVVTQIDNSADGTISILFDADQERTFLTSLVEDKLAV